MEVLYGHSIAHLGLKNIPFLDEFIRFFSGVPIFFTMSGFLIWWSIGRSSNFVQYLRKRFWRIYPELWAAVFVELLVLLCLYNKPFNWLEFGTFALAQSSFFQFWTPDFLRGYGCGCPNGSLWTIGVLIQFYFFAYFIYKFLHGKKICIWAFSFIVTLAMSLSLSALHNFLPEIIGKLVNQTVFPYLWMFLAASFVAEKKEMILPVIKRYWWALLLLLLFVRGSGYDIRASYHVFHTILLFLCLVGASYVFPALNIKTDISYGIYIYHMTVVNALLALEYKGDVLLLFVVLVITSILAWLSTKTIGRLSKKMKYQS